MVNGMYLYSALTSPVGPKVLHMSAEFQGIMTEESTLVPLGLLTNTSNQKSEKIQPIYLIKEAVPFKVSVRLKPLSL